MWQTRENRDGMSDLIVKAAVKDALSDQNVSADFYDGLNEEVAELLNDAAERAEANDRKTVQPRDL
jgi:histone H3/H4